MLPLWSSKAIPNGKGQVTKRKCVLAAKTKQNRIGNYVRSGEFKSGKLRWKSRRKARKILGICSKQIWENYYEDNLKAPLNNPAKPASISKASMNFYFGTNKEVKGDLVLRTAYAVGSGVTSIGLDPSTMKVHALFPEMSELMGMAHEAVMTNPKVAHTMQDKYFNFCSVKIYFSFRDEKGKLVRKNTNWHVDVTSDKQGKPLPNNSQVPGTPVVIATFGDTKILEFRRQGRHGNLDNNSHLEFSQENGSIFVLHPDDEKIDYLQKHWRHKSEMKLVNNNKPNPDAVTFAFMFRVVQGEVWLNVADSTLANPPLPKKFNGSKGKFYTEHYKEESQKLQNKMQKLFVNFSCK
jgi:hypothetical protein